MPVPTMPIRVTGDWEDIGSIPFKENVGGEQDHHAKCRPQLRVRSLANGKTASIRNSMTGINLSVRLEAKSKIHDFVTDSDQWPQIATFFLAVQ
jgi:hypothetical protein